MNKLYAFLREETYVPLLYRKKTYVTTEEDLSRLVIMIENVPYLTDLGCKAVEDYIVLTKDLAADVFVPDFAQMLTMFKRIIKPEKIKIDSYKKADQVGKLQSYFSYHDILKLCEDSNVDDIYEYVYNGDYYEYIRTLDLNMKDIVVRYMRYLQSISIRTDFIDYTTFNGGGVSRSMSQLEEYEAILIKGDKYILPSDGYGIASCYCIMNDISYRSYEPNAVGDVARELGIIHSQTPIYTNHDYYESQISRYEKIQEKYELTSSLQLLYENYKNKKQKNKKKFYSSYLYVYLYCCQYYSIPEIPRQRYIILDISYASLSGKYKEGSRVSSNSKMDLDKRRTLILRAVYRRKELKFDSIYPLDVVAARLGVNANLRVETMEKCSVILSMSKVSVYQFAKVEKRSFILSKVLYMPSWVYPFKEGSKYVFGKMYGKEMYVNYGTGNYFRDKEYEFKECMDEEVEYILVDQIFAIPGTRPTPVRTIRLLPSDKERFGGQSIVRIYMLSSMSIGGIVYGMYAEVSNTDPNSIII